MQRRQANEGTVWWQGLSRRLVGMAAALALMASLVVGIGEVQAQPLDDVVGTTHEAAITSLLDRGLVSGFEDKTFRPGRSVTRGQIASMLTAALELEPRGEAVQLTDIEGTTHERGILAVVGAAIAQGFDDGSFRPQSELTRGQLATMFVGAFDLPEADPFGYADTVGTTHEDAINAVTAAGIAQGFADGRFGPRAFVTRGQMATMLVAGLDWLEAPPADHDQDEEDATPGPGPAPAPAPPSPSPSPGGTGQVTFAPDSLELELERLGATAQTIEATIDTDLEDVSLELAGGLVGEPVELGDVVAGTYELELPIAVATTAEVGDVVAGTVQMTSGAGPLDGELTVTVTVTDLDPEVSTTAIRPVSPARLIDAPGGDVVEDELLVGLQGSTDPELATQVAADLGAQLVGTGADGELFIFLLPAPRDLAGLLDTAANFEEDPRLEFAFPRQMASTMRLPNDPEWSSWNVSSPGGNNWHLERIDAPGAWDITTGSSDVNVAVIDGDFELGHEDLDISIARGTRYDQGGHGTHVAGTICATGDNGIGVTGVAWNCDLRTYEVGVPHSTINLDTAEIYSSMVLAVQDGADIVNMSLGTPCDAGLFTERAYSLMLARAQNYGQPLWVVAAGNSSCDAETSFPAGLSLLFPTSVIAVGGTNIDGELSNFSNTGPAVSLAAPAGRTRTNPLTGRTFTLRTTDVVLSTLPFECRWFGLSCASRYGGMPGTSMAAPQVAGTAALMLAVSPDLTPGQLRQCLRVSAADKPVSGHDFGELDARLAVECAQGAIDTPIGGLPDRVDVVLSVDLTGSMGGVVNTVKEEILTTLDDLDEFAPGTDFAFAVTSFEDYPGFFDSGVCPNSSYSATYGGASDEPWRLDLPLVTDADLVRDAVQDLTLGFGGDGPESYGRVLWELAQDDTGALLGWRPGAARVVVMFGDDIPHDPNLHAGFAEGFVPSIPRDTGIDPGRSGEINCGGDDIGFYDALDALVERRTRLLYVNNSPLDAYQEAWGLWASITGGAAARIESGGGIEDGLGQLLRDLLGSASFD